MPNEKKYVEANIVFDKLTEWAKNIRFELNWAELCKLNNCIIDAPVADVAEVRHGGCEYCREVETQNKAGRKFFKELTHLSINKTTLDDAHLQIAQDTKGVYLHLEDENGDRMFDVKINYCPMCGARMDGGYSNVK